MPIQKSVVGVQLDATLACMPTPRVVILDDQPGLADLLALSLREYGYSTVGFTRPADALAALKEADVLVTDYHMPEMTGLEVARQAYAKGWRGSLMIMS